MTLREMEALDKLAVRENKTSNKKIAFVKNKTSSKKNRIRYVYSLVPTLRTVDSFSFPLFVKKTPKHSEDVFPHHKFYSLFWSK